MGAEPAPGITWRRFNLKDWKVSSSSSSDMEGVRVCLCVCVLIVCVEPHSGLESSSDHAHLEQPHVVSNGNAASGKKECSHEPLLLFERKQIFMHSKNMKAKSPHSLYINDGSSLSYGACCFLDSSCTYCLSVSRSDHLWMTGWNNLLMLASFLRACLFFKGAQKKNEWCLWLSCCF